MTIYEEPFGRLRPFGVGFDEMFKKLDAIHNQPQGNYPPYNIVKLDEESFVIEIAAAGFSKKDFKIDLKDSSLKVIADVKTFGKTGVEMEALTAVSISCLTIYDMCKSIDKSIVIKEIKLIAKKGGKSDFKVDKY